jgi:hypothetical protein
MKTINVSDEEYAFLIELVNNLKTQDGRITSDPIFEVQECRKEPRPEGYNSDDSYFLEHVTGNYGRYDTLFAAYRDLLEREYPKPRIRANVEEVNYTLEWQAVTSCFTEVGADRFIARNRHNFHPLRTYVASLCHNYEMATLRKLLLNLTLSE